MNLLFKIEPDLPMGHFNETVQEERSRRESNKPLRDKFSKAANGHVTRGFGSREVAEFAARQIDFGGVPVKITEYIPLNLI